MNQDLSQLHAYPFEKLARLKEHAQPPQELAHIALSIGEPRHPAPAFVAESIIQHLNGLAHYPLTRGELELREAIASWLIKRFKLPANSLDANQHILPVNGTREALFAFAQSVVDRSLNPVVVMPNPFYQIYEGAALLAGAEPYYLNTTEKTQFTPDFDSVPASIWQRCQLLYLCSPGNPTGAVLDSTTLEKILNLAEQYNFIIAADECYSEIYFDESRPPVGLLQVAAQTGNTAYKRCMVFHSLSKRSNLPGLRSGFVAGDADIVKQFLKYRTYHGSAMPPHHQSASIAAWQDENHVIQNRKLYMEKFIAVLDILKPVIEVKQPDASFYLWPKTPISETEFARGLYQQQNVTVLPGSYLSRDVDGGNPGLMRIRMALVANKEECIEAANRMVQYIQSLD